MCVSATVGTLFGSLAGYFGGRVDDAISRVVDVLMAFPGILLAIALVAVLGPNLVNVVLALSVIGWVGYARLVRGQVLRGRELEFVQAARSPCWSWDSTSSVTACGMSSIHGAKSSELAAGS